MKVIKNDIKDLNSKAFKDFKKNIVGHKPFVIQNLKEWFGGQKVHIIAKDYKGVRIPSELEGKAGLKIVDILDRVWLTKGEVAEGIINDLIFGCMKDPREPMTFDEAKHCINDLRQLEYIQFSDSDGNTGEQAWHNLPITQIWFRLTPKFTSMLIAITI